MPGQVRTHTHIAARELIRRMDGRTVQYLTRKATGDNDHARSKDQIARERRELAESRCTTKYQVESMYQQGINERDIRIDHEQITKCHDEAEQIL